MPSVPFRMVDSNPAVEGIEHVLAAVLVAPGARVTVVATRDQLTDVTDVINVPETEPRREQLYQVSPSRNTTTLRQEGIILHCVRQVHEKSA